MQQENIKANSLLMQNDEICLKVGMYEMDIVWENKEENLGKVHALIKQISGQVDLLVLPEMFSTGFSMNIENLAEKNNGQTIQLLSQWAEKYHLAICGSFIAKQESKYFNRGFFISPSLTTYFYDKRHLFRMGDEANHYSSGVKQTIIPYNGFNICLQICYDLRFPVWARNVNNKYDLLIYVANWPQSRISVWDTLLAARAIENQAYVCGVNRTGTDGLGLFYNGHSALCDYMGNHLNTKQVYSNDESCLIVDISKNKLNLFRNKFPVWKDADKFTLNT